MRSARRKGATPAGGESGGRQTVRLRGGRAGPVHTKAYVYPGQVTNRSRHADNENALSVIGSLAVSSSAEAGRRPAAAFFDLDKTIIAKSSTLAYGPSFYRNGLISRGDAVRGAVAQLLFTRHGASHDRMEQIRAQVSQVCRGWPAERVREIVARHLDELIVPYVYDEARALLDAHRAAGEDVIIVSTSGVELVGRSGPGWVPPWSSPPRWRSPKAATRARWTSTRTVRPRRIGSGNWPANAATGWPTAPPT